MKNTARLFLDSNVILSGLLSSKGSPRILLDLLSLEVPLLLGITGQYNLEEIERNLSLRFPHLVPIYQDYLPKLRLTVIPMPPYTAVEPLFDKMSPKDAPVLVSARLGNADYLITGDKKGFPIKLAHPISIISPTIFLQTVLPDLINSR